MSDSGISPNGQNVELLREQNNHKNGGHMNSEASLDLVNNQKKKQKENPNRKQKKSHFPIEVSTLEKVMGYYKERGSDYQDLKFFKENGGTTYLVNGLKSDIHNGISDLSHREDEFGSNKVFVEPVPPFCSYVLEALEDMMLRILIVAAIVSIVLGCTLSDDPSTDWIDGVSIIVAVIVVTLVGSITNWKKETKFHELNEIQAEGTKYKVIRKGEPNDFISDDLLVGDLIMVNYGDIMPADLFLVEGNGIKMDESALTGESDAMKKESYEKCEEIKNQGNKSVPSPLILSGTNCIEGSGKALVIAVGDHSQKGIIRRTVDNAQENNKTPLEEKLDDIAEMIGWFGLGAAIVTLVALFIRFGFSFSKEKKEYDKDSSMESLMTAYVQNAPNDIDKEGVTTYINNNLTNPNSMIAKKILDIVILCVSIIVVAIPEGLPLAVTLSLAFSIKKMMDQNNLVRKMHACETMGGANYICTDKTGTLTKNEMSVFQVLTGDKTKFGLQQNLEVENVGNVSSNKKKNPDEIKQIRENHNKQFPNDTYWEVLKVAIALNIEGQIKKLDVPDINGDNEICETKNKTDKAFIDFLYRFKSPISVERDKYLDSSDNFKQFPFDSKRKRMTTFVKSSDFPKGYRLFSKGGAEKAVSYCKFFLNPKTGNVEPLKDENLNFITDTIEDFNKDKLRSLYICYKDITQAEYDNCEVVDNNGNLIDQKDLIFVAVFGIRDSLRDGVKEAVLKCHEASVNVIMVTGDNIVTATAIAKDCNILGNDVDLKHLTPKDIEEDPEQMNDESKREKHIARLLECQPKALTGNSFYNAVGGLICDVCKLETNECKCPKTEAEAKQIAEKNKTDPEPVKKDVIKNMEAFTRLSKNLCVMARSQPIHKYALVLGLRSLHNVVAVTGDGTNDAPALSKSDVGFAMFAGTDIAKEASDIVIIDNNFSSIVVAIIYGRNIYDNIRKFLQFQLTVNFCACILVFICACVGNETPLTSIQMLWVNLIMDSLGSLALATEPPYEELLKREPTKRNEHIINGRMWKHISIQALCELVLLLILYLMAPKFIKENNYVRLAENQIINLCYGKLPGDGKLDHIIYGTSSKWSSDVKLKANEEVCGKYSERQDLSVAFKEYSNANGSTVHMTIIFNVFVYYTLFNQINCRVLDDSFNILIRITRSILFIIICIFEMGLQAILITWGNTVFHCVERGLTGKQWGICIGFSAITFVVSIICKLLPIEKLIDKCIGDVEEEKENNEEKSAEIKSGEHSKKNSENQIINVIKDDQIKDYGKDYNKINSKEGNTVDRNVKKDILKINDSGKSSSSDSY